MSHVLDIRNLKKKYTRSGPWVIDDLSFHVPRGSICGLIGPNGAGKTTLYALISGFLLPNAGEIDILSMGPFHPWTFRGRLGVLPQDAEIDGRLSCKEFLHYMGTLQGLSYKEAHRASLEALKEVNLLDRANHRVSTLSHGMIRRVATASALLGHPELVLLDEPMAGLDPAQAASLRDVFLSYRGKGSLMISSHNLSELERICDWIVVIEKGRLMMQGALDSITKNHALVHWQLSPTDVDIRTILSAHSKLNGHSFSFDAQTHTLTQQAPDIDALDPSALVIAQVLLEHHISIRSCQRGRSLEASVLNKNPIK